MKRLLDKPDGMAVSLKNPLSALRIHNRRNFSFSAVLTLVTILIFTFTACKSSSDDFIEPVYSGKFNITADIIGVEDQVLFELNNGAEKAVTSSSYALSGKLKDASGIHELWGSYDPDSLWFVLSADGEGLRYCISGAFDSQGNIPIKNASAFNKAKDDDSAADTFEFYDNSGAAIDGNAGDPIGGMPNDFLGRWLYYEEEDITKEGKPATKVGKGVLLISRFTMALSATETDTIIATNERTLESNAFKFLIADVKVQSDGSYDIIVVDPRYEKDKSSIEAAFGAYCEFKGVDAEAVTDDTDPMWADSDKLLYYGSVDGNGLYLNCYGDFSTESDWEEFMHAYLRDTLGQTPVTGYGKYNYKIEGGDLHFVQCHLIPDDGGSYPTLAEAEAAMKDVGSDIATLTRE